MKNLKRMVEQRDTIAGKIFDYAIQGLIVLSLISFSIDTLPKKHAAFGTALHIIELVCIAIFTVEYILRITVSDKKIRFIFSFYGLVDLIAILPFYLAHGIDLRSVRAFRLLRVFKLFRYHKPIYRLSKALVIVKDELILFGSVTLIMLFIAAVGIYYFEHPAQPQNIASVFDGLWWAVATLTTVGYGDIYPVTTGGRIFTFIILMIGLGIVAVPTGLLAAALSEAKEKVREDE